MKKFFTFMAAAMLTASVNAQSEQALKVLVDNKGWNEESGCVLSSPVKYSENVQLNFNGQYQAFNIVNEDNAFSPADYKGLKVQYKLGADNTSSINVHVNVGKPESWSGMYQPLDANKEEIYFDFSTEVKALEKIKQITLQQADQGAASVLLKKIILVKNDGTEEQLKNFASTGNGLLDLYDAPSLKYRAAYSNVQIVDNDGNSLTYDPTDGTVQKYTIEYEAKPGITLLLLPTKEEKDQWGNHAVITYFYNVSNDSKVEVTLHPQYMYATKMVQLRLQANNTADNFPAEVKIKSIKRSISTYTDKVTIASSGFATHASYYPVDYSAAGLKAYAVKLNGNKVSYNEVTGVVPANTAVLLKGTAGAEINLPKASEGGSAIDTDLKMSFGEVYTKNSTVAYALATPQGEETGFYPVKANSSIAAQRGFLQVESTPSQAAFFSLGDLSGETTGISSVANSVEKADAPMYNLAGQAVGKGYKGLVIKNGKKFMVK